METKSWTDKVKKALADCKGISWDGCHKIYILATEDDVTNQISYGYSVERPSLETISNWWYNSCELRFVDGIRNGKFFDVIPQGS